MANKAKKKTKKRLPGPKPDVLTINYDWQDALGKAIKKKRPESGWPKPEKGKKS